MLMIPKISSLFAVAPRAGAWIEMPSHLRWSTRSRVAPRAGAWIEMLKLVPGVPDGRVAPRAGACIEISGSA